jgi:hypothetical protein
MNYKTKTEKTFTADIYIAGDINTIRTVCRKWCRRGACVTITPTQFAYTGGFEDGAIIGLINYPRFPSTPEQVIEKATDLTKILIEECCQLSASIVTSDKTIFIYDEKKEK